MYSSTHENRHKLVKNKSQNGSLVSATNGVPISHDLSFIVGPEFRIPGEIQLNIHSKFTEIMRSSKVQDGGPSAHFGA